MDRIRLLLALFSLLIGGCNLGAGGQYQAGYEAEVQGDDSRAFDYYLNAAQGNDFPQARYSVASMYLEGRGTRQDTGEAIRWFERVADAGDPVWSPLAHLQLGTIYRGDYGDQYRNREQAATHFSACAEQGDEECARLLALLDRPAALAPASPAVAAPAPADSAAMALYARREPSVYKIVVYEQLGAGLEPISLGSAIAIDPYRAVTNYHLVQAGGVPVSINTGKEYVREEDVLVWQVVKVDPRRDLALLALRESGLKLNFTNAIKPFNQVRVGERVYAIGAPAGLDKTLTEGIVSALRTDAGVRLIQTTAPITYGSSGGALFDADGQLIGITTKGVQAGGNFNFAVAVDEVQAFLAE